MNFKISIKSITFLRVSSPRHFILLKIPGLGPLEINSLPPLFSLRSRKLLYSLRYAHFVSATPTLPICSSYFFVLSPFLFAAFLWFSWPNRRRVFPPLIARTLRHYGHKSPSKNQFSKQQAGQKQKRGEKRRGISDRTTITSILRHLYAPINSTYGERERESPMVSHPRKSNK